MNQLDLFNSGLKDEQRVEAIFISETDEHFSNTENFINMKEDTLVAKKMNIHFEKEIYSKPAPVSAHQREKKTAIASSGRGRKSYKDMDAETHLVEVPDDEILFQKQYYSISDVAQWFNVNNSVIRFWENEFDILKPKKNRKGDRLFRPEDVKNLQLIYHLLRERKFSIEGARQYLKDNKKKAELNMQLINTLNKFRSFLLELKATIGD